MRYQIVDCRWELANAARGRELYLEGHIPTASFLDVDRDLSGPPGPRGRHPLPEPDDFARAAGEAGIGPDIFVVAHGSTGGAERLWWLLGHFGHDFCAVVDLDSWRGRLATGAEEIAAAQFKPRPCDADTIDAEELNARRDELIILDARVPERFRGAEPGRQGARTDPRRAQHALEPASAGDPAR
ncbi:MAG: rhodanese-like domain-containing protein [Actinomycetota bacterium]|nr:rhodanese-like domain-containing protein [Actinomycetota bacterium]